MSEHDRPSPASGNPPVWGTPPPARTAPRVVEGFGEIAVIGSALHGEFVVPEGAATITERIQTGSVTAVSGTGITVKTTDGFSATYAVGSDLDVSAFPTGSDVTVIAKLGGTTATVTSVVAAQTTNTENAAGGFGRGRAGS